MSGYAFNGFCFSSINSAAVAAGSTIQLSGALVSGVPVISGTQISIPLKALVSTNFVDIQPYIYNIQSCDNPGHVLTYEPFNPGTMLDHQQLSSAYAAGFIAVSIPLVIALAVSSLLSFLRSNHV